MQHILFLIVLPILVAGCAHGGSRPGMKIVDRPVFDQQRLELER